MDKILSIIFIMTIAIGFYGVHYVSANFENDDNAIALSVSDSALTFGELVYTNEPTSYWDGYETGLYLYKDATHFTYAKTPVYLGNDTWSFSYNTTDDLSNLYYVIEMPNLDDWIIDEITTNMTLPIDTDRQVSIFFFSSMTNELDYNNLASYRTNIFTKTPVTVVNGWWNQTEDLSLSTALNVYDKASANDHHFMVIWIDDTSNDGFTANTWNLKFEITGHQVATYNLPQQVNIVLVGSIFLNVLVMTYMTDAVDWGGFVNDIPNRKRRK